MSRIADERHPRKQGLKRKGSPEVASRGPQADERHPRKQGLKLLKRARRARGRRQPMSVIQENKD